MVVDGLDGDDVVISYELLLIPVGLRRLNPTRRNGGMRFLCLPTLNESLQRMTERKATDSGGAGTPALGGMVVSLSLIAYFE